MRKMTQEALGKIDERGDQGDGDIDGLFQGGSLRNSGESVTLGEVSTSTATTNEMRLTTETEDDGTDETKVSKQTTAKEERKKLPFEEFDATYECTKLRRETGEPFCRGNDIWLRRRELWAQPARTNSIGESIRRKRRFSIIPKQYYVRIYKKLSIDDKPLKEPLNLQDALKVIDAGWTEIRRCEEAAAANGMV